MSDRRTLLGRKHQTLFPSAAIPAHLASRAAARERLGSPRISAPPVPAQHRLVAVRRALNVHTHQT